MRRVEALRGLQQLSILAPERLKAQGAHLMSPRLAVDLLLELELSEVMGVAQGVTAPVALVAG
jgi:hypothetical protein